MKARTKWLIVGVLCLLAMVFAVCPSLAEQKMKFKAKVVFVVKERKVYNIGDMKGHVFGLSFSRGVDILSKSVWKSYGFFDLVNLKGPLQGISIARYPNGDKVSAKWKGRLIVKSTPKGKPVMILLGTWQFIGGTGKWKGVQGGGTSKNWHLERNILIADIVGDYIIKK